MDSYWDSPEGHRHKMRGRQEQGTHIFLDHEPRQKRRGHDALEFRLDARTNLLSLRKKPWWPRAALALDLHFWTTRRQPPRIERLAKHYIDLLGATNAPAEDPGPVLFNDDSQVKLLHVSCHHSWHSTESRKPRIRVECQSRASVVAEFEAVGKIGRLVPDFDDDSPWAPPDPLLGDAGLEDLDDLAAIGDELSSSIAAEVHLWLLHAHQEELLRQADDILRMSLQQNARRLLTGEIPRDDRLLLGVGDPAIERQLEQLARWNSLRDDLSRWFRVPLPPLPLREGEGARFREAARASCRAFLARWPRLVPLLVPLRISILVVPPSEKLVGPGFNKDLDNVAFDLMGVIECEFGLLGEPHQRGEDAGVGEGAGDAVRQRRRADELAMFRELHPSGVSGFHVIELARSDGDPEEGWLAIVPGFGFNWRSFWEEAADLNERMLDEACDRW